MHEYGRRSGFSLVEVLITIAVVALLMGLLLPALTHARGAGRSAQCRSNLRQMGIAATLYAAQYERWPTALRFESQPTFRTIAWDWVTDPSGIVRPGALWAFASDPDRVMQCPILPEPEEGSTGDPYTGYNYNTSFIGGEAPFPLTGWDAVRPGVRPHAVRRADRTAIFGCGGRRGGTNKFMRAPGNDELLALSTIYSGGQHFGHVGGTTTAAWIDGHVSVVHTSHEGIHATPALLEQFMDHPRNGFLSQDDRSYDPR